MHPPPVPIIDIWHYAFVCQYHTVKAEVSPPRSLLLCGRELIFAFAVLDRHLERHHFNDAARRFVQTA